MGETECVHGFKLSSRIHHNVLTKLNNLKIRASNLTEHNEIHNIIQFNQYVVIFYYISYIFLFFSYVIEWNK